MRLSHRSERAHDRAVALAALDASKFEAKRYTPEEGRVYEDHYATMEEPSVGGLGLKHKITRLMRDGRERTAKDVSRKFREYAHDSVSQALRALVKAGSLNAEKKVAENLTIYSWPRTA